MPTVWASMRLLGGIYLLAALMSVFALWVDRLNRVTPNDWSIVIEIVAFTAALFFVPCTILGMISPIVAKLAVNDLAKAGSTVGNIYAAGALGSIVGTFATGFWLIAWFGTYTIIWGVGLVLAAMGLFFLIGARWQTAIIAILALVGASYFAIDQNWLKNVCVRETNYYCIKIIDQEQDGKPVRLLVLDHLVHSYVDLTSPLTLVYGYEKIYAEVVQYRASTNPRMRVGMIGGGGYTFARYMEAKYPDSEMNVVEIDPGVTQTAHDMLALPRDTKTITFNEDARLYFARTPTKKYDLVLGDAFNHYSVPYHLTTKEFNDRVREWLTPDGMYVMNIIDGPYGEFVRASVNTLQQTFRYVYVDQGNWDWRHATRSFFVLIGTDKPLDVATLANFDAGDGDSLLARLLMSQEDVDKMLAEAPRVTLTDQFAPVDQMLASAFRDEVPK